MGLPEDRRPRWLKVSTGSHVKAHLLNPASHFATAWCGTKLESQVDGHFEERCALCLEKFKEYVDSVLMPPPEMITERFVFTVTRPAASEDVEAGIARALASRRTWTWNLQALSDLEEEP